MLQPARVGYSRMCAATRVHGSHIGGQPTYSSKAKPLVGNHVCKTVPCSSLAPRSTPSALDTPGPRLSHESGTSTLPIVCVHSPGVSSHCRSLATDHSHYRIVSPHVTSDASHLVRKCTGSY